MNADPPDSRFQTTLWSVVLRAGGVESATKHAALDQLCRFYWKPLWVYCIRKGFKAENAEDLTQSFFVHLLAKDALRLADPARGRFRAFLLTSFKNFISDEGDRSRTQRRGGGVAHFSFEMDFRNVAMPVHSSEATPELAYDRQWALDLVERATARLRSEHEASGKGAWFDRILGSSAGTGYAALAVELSSTEEAVKSFAKRARRRFREILECEIADTVGSPEEAAEEMAYLVELLRG